MKSMLRDYQRGSDGLYRKTIHFGDSPAPITLVRDGDGHLIRIEEPCRTIEIPKPKHLKTKGKK